MKLRWRIASCTFVSLIATGALIAIGALIWLLPQDSFVLLHSAAADKCKLSDNCTGSAVHDAVGVCNLQQSRTLESCRIVVSECFGRGRLGNSMFILASMLAVARQHGLLQAVPANSRADAQLVQLKSLFNVTTSLPVHSGSALAYRRVSESGWSVFNPAVLHSGSFGRLTMLGCYMQSWRYFSGHEDAVRLMFALTDRYKYYTERYFRSVKADLLSLAKDETIAAHVFVAVHVRRGDMVPQKENYNVADDRFISRACYYFRNKYLNASSTVFFVVASDDPAWARTVMERQHGDGAFVVYTNGTAEEDMAVLASCHHAIITSGTFGWWAAWLTGGDVVYFRDFVQPNSALWSGYKADDYYPSHWLGIP